MLTACQTKKEAVPDRRQIIHATSEADYACSYFYFLWGRYSELLLRFEEALEFYQKALICDEEAEYISEKIPALLLRLERVDEAAVWLQRYLALNPDKTAMRMLYAKALLGQNKTAEAMQQYQLISERHPKDPAILLLLAEMYLSVDQTDQAKQLLDRVLSEDRESYPAQLLMARLYQAEGDIDQAIAAYRKALERNDSIDVQMELGELFVKNERYDEAEALYEQLVAEDDQSESARLALIHVYLLQKKDALALAELNRLKKYVDQPRHVDLTIARLYAKQQQYDRAIAVLERIVEKENLAEARYLLALLLAHQQKYDRALKHVRHVDRKSPEYLEALFLHVRILKEQNKVTEAKALLRSCLDTPEYRNAELYILLAALYQLEGRTDQGKKVLLRGLENFPNDENLLYEYGLILEDSGEHSAALAVMQRIIALQPDNAAALNFVGFSWADKKINLNQALDYIQKAVKLKPDNGYIRDSLGWVYFRLGKLDQAIEELETAVRLSPEDAVIMEHLADVYLEKGRLKDALSTYKKALILAAEEEKGKDRIREKIRMLEQQ
ncbi:MAG: tetratricopeptide repeat protein, partial [Desulfobulbus sp.]|nr:tetratricopeptide repeat protein [Desulfobulbus sp.]